MRRLLAIALAMAPALAAAQTSNPIAVVATPITVDNSSGPQTEPRISGQLVAYTSGEPTSPLAEVHIYNGSAHFVASKGRSPDISGSRVVFTRADGTRTAIYLGEYDAATNQIQVFELADPSGGPVRDRASIASHTVAWVDNGPNGTAAESGIVVFDLNTRQSVRIDLRGGDSQPAVAPDGNAVVWTNCDGPCDIVRAVPGPSGGWVSARLLTGVDADEKRPATDGKIVAYESYRQSDWDLWYQPLEGGAETRLPLDGLQANASVAGGLIAFESTPVGGTADIYVYDSATSLLYRLTDSPEDNDRLSDIDVDATGVVTVVYASTLCDPKGAKSADANICALSFSLQPAPPACGTNTGEVDTCASPGIRSTVAAASLTLTRETGSPTASWSQFDSAEGIGLLCVDNGSPSGIVATSAELGLNGAVLFGTSDFQKNVLSLGGRVQLLAHNALWGTIAGEPGTTYTITVYGPPLCGTDALIEGSPLRARGYAKEELHAVLGEFLEDRPLPPGRCATTTGGASLLALLIVAVLVLRPRVQRALARRTERR
jgi:hypothetical protein